MIVKLSLGIIAFLLIGCDNHKVTDLPVTKPISYEVYRYNFIDKEYCNDCVDASFFKAISISSIICPENLIAKCTIKNKVDSLYDCFQQVETRTIIKTAIDNKFVLAFRFADGRKDIYSYEVKKEWLLNDSIIVKPNRNVFEVIRKLEKLGDLTDYRYVSKAPTPVAR